MSSLLVLNPPWVAGEEVEGWEGEEGSLREMNTGCAMGLGALAVVGIIQRWGGGR